MTNCLHTRVPWAFEVTFAAIPRCSLEYLFPVRPERSKTFLCTGFSPPDPVSSGVQSFCAGVGTSEQVCLIEYTINHGTRPAGVDLRESTLRHLLQVQECFTHFSFQLSPARGVLIFFHNHNCAEVFIFAKKGKFVVLACRTWSLGAHPLRGAEEYHSVRIPTFGGPPSWINLQRRRRRIESLALLLTH